MAPEWEAMGADLGMGIHHRHHNHSTSTTTMPPAPTSMMSHHFYGGGDHSFFPAPAGATAAEAPPPASGSFNLSFADDFSIPMQSEEAAELEWLSHFIDDSYPDMPNYPPEVAAAAAQQNNSNKLPSSAAASTGARTKRSRAASWLLPSLSSSTTSQIIRSDNAGKNKNRPPAPAAYGGGEDTTTNNSSNGSEVRRCTHCASEKTPQWRTGPLGPKTLCNACGVRYKSGRLVPEYRPASSPTFVLTQHSNSHRKVMELRRQKELLHLRGASSSGSASAAAFRDYGVC